VEFRGINNSVRITFTSVGLIFQAFFTVRVCSYAYFLLVRCGKPIRLKDEKLEIIKMMGERLKTIRAQKGFTQLEIAEKTGITANYLSNIERGLENPTINTIIGLANSLEVDMGDIFYSLQIESPQERKKRIRKFINMADDEQLKLMEKILSILSI
jgi:transcriptional regulator with XRE-family HTH domain